MIFMINAQVSKTLSCKDKKKQNWALCSAKWVELWFNPTNPLAVADHPVLQKTCFYHDRSSYVIWPVRIRKECWVQSSSQTEWEHRLFITNRKTPTEKNAKNLINSSGIPASLRYALKKSSIKLYTQYGYRYTTYSTPSKECYHRCQIPSIFASHVEKKKRTSKDCPLLYS